MKLSRKLQLLLGYLKAIPGDFASSRRDMAYRQYLATTFAETRFGFGCVVGDDCQFEEGVNIGPRTTLTNTRVGRYTSIGFDSVYHNCQIGGFCSLGPRVLAGLGRHPTDFVSTSPAFYSPNHSAVRIAFVDKQKFEESLPIVIGSDTWIGAQAVLLDGITIGHGAIIGAGAVVTKDIEPYAIVGGIPAKLIRKRFSDEIIADLLALRWWEKPADWLMEHAKHFHDVHALLDPVVDCEPV